MEETVLHRALVSSCPWGIDLSPGQLTSAAPFWLVLISLATIMESDSAEELVNILNSCRVPESLSAFVTRAYETTSDFAFAFPKLENMDSLLRDLDEDTLRSMGVEPPASVLTSLPASRLRKALKLCHDLSMQPQPAPASQVTPTPVRSLDNSMHTHEWAENLPPKLTTETVDSLVSTFKQNYPGELLDQDSMPSIRLLSLVHEGGFHGSIVLAKSSTRKSWKPRPAEPSGVRYNYSQQPSQTISRR